MYVIILNQNDPPLIRNLNIFNIKNKTNHLLAYYLPH
jgi:hypothetical protein